MPAKSDLGSAFGFTETETSRLVEQRVRLAQHRFAKSVLANYDWACGFCGFTPGPLRGYHLLIASHVKPWAVSSNKERADVSNGICACPNHDSAFDFGLLTLNPDLRIQMTGLLHSSLGAHEELDRVFGNRGMRDALLVPAGAKRPSEDFLAFHRSKVFRQ